MRLIDGRIEDQEIERFGAVLGSLECGVAARGADNPVPGAGYDIFCITKAARFGECDQDRLHISNATQFSASTEVS